MLKKEYILPAIIVLFLLLQKGSDRDKSFLGDMSKPRGIRNNNPGNLKISSSEWKGKIPVQNNTDGTFEQFQNWYYGIRAMWRLISNYIQSGNNTIAKIVGKYAPTSENNTNTYINYVSSFTGINPNENLTGRDLYPVIDAMSRLENGTQLGQVISVDDYKKAIAI